MALTHQFAIIPKDSNEKLVSADMNVIEVPDYLICYFKDSLQWIYSSWNGKVKKQGISYYGYSVVENGQIEKFMGIISQWKKLFELAPAEFCITGEYLPDKKQYKKIDINKEETLQLLDDLVCICKYAIEKEAKILHNGI